ncbi:unnamed protein product [Wickerhamomyces anomalus]
MSSTAVDIKKTQAEFSKSLHGKEVGTKTGISALLSKDKSAQEVAVADYLKHWDGKTDKDAEDKRLEDYNQTNKIGIKEGWKVLDVGCGVGGPAREIARFTGAHITGLNNNDYQIEKANYYARKFKLDNQLNFVKGDFMKMDFEPETFDAVYAIEATVHAPVLEGVYGEIFKTLKPGGVFGVYEWVMTENYDETNPEHRKIAYEIELGDGIPKMYSVDVARKALENVGFEIEYEQDLADLDDDIPWYYPLTGDVKYIQSLYDLSTFVRTSYLGRKITTGFVGLLEFLRIAPKGSKQVTLALEEAAVGLVEGGKQKLFTPMQLFVARKPLK